MPTALPSCLSTGPLSESASPQIIQRQIKDLELLSLFVLLKIDALLHSVRSFTEFALTVFH